MSDGAKQIDLQRMRLKMAFLMSASSAVLITAMLMPKSAQAATYTVSNETELRDAIADANGRSDPEATINLSGNIALSSGTAFPTGSPTKTITINTNGFTLSGYDSPSGTVPAGPVSFNGVEIVNSGSIRGGNGFTPANGDSSNGGIGLVLSNGSVTNNGTITGGDGSDWVGGLHGGAREGADLTNSTLVNNGTITGGRGGVASNGGIGGAGGLILRGDR